MESLTTNPTPAPEDPQQHDQMVRRIADYLENQEGLRRCTVFSVNATVEVVPDTYYPEPDVVVSCNILDCKAPFIRQPRMLIEVMTDATRHDDEGFKWQQYQKLSTLWYYLLVDADERRCTLYSHYGYEEAWKKQTLTGSDVIELTRLELALPLDAIYAK